MPHESCCPVRKTGKSSYAILKAEREEMKKKMEEMTDEIKQTKAHIEQVADKYDDLRRARFSTSRQIWYSPSRE